MILMMKYAVAQVYTEKKIIIIVKVMIMIKTLTVLVSATTAMKVIIARMVFVVLENVSIFVVAFVVAMVWLHLTLTRFVVQEPIGMMIPTVAFVRPMPNVATSATIHQDYALW